MTRRPIKPLSFQWNTKANSRHNRGQDQGTLKTFVSQADSSEAYITITRDGGNTAGVSLSRQQTARLALQLFWLACPKPFWGEKIND